MRQELRRPGAELSGLMKAAFQGQCQRAWGYSANTTTLPWSWFSRMGPWREQKPPAFLQLSQLQERLGGERRWVVSFMEPPSRFDQGHWWELFAGRLRTQDCVHARGLQEAGRPFSVDPCLDLSAWSQNSVTRRKMQTLNGPHPPTIPRSQLLLCLGAVLIRTHCRGWWGEVVCFFGHWPEDSNASLGSWSIMHLGSQWKPGFLNPWVASNSVPA